jgi:hypothetical protein
MGRDDGNKFDNGTRNRMWVPENTRLCRSDSTNLGKSLNRLRYQEFALRRCP